MKTRTWLCKISFFINLSVFFWFRHYSTAVFYLLFFTTTTSFITKTRATYNFRILCLGCQGGTSEGGLSPGKNYFLGGFL